MIDKRETYEEILSLMSRDFDRRFLNDPEFSESLPENAYILFQLRIHGVKDPSFLKEVERFNRWVREVCEPQIDPDHTMVEAVLSITIPRLAAHRLLSFRPALSLRLIEEMPRDFELVPA